MPTGDSDQRISLDPDPPVQGKPVKICYNFAGSGISGTTLRVSFDDGTGTDHEVSAASPCVTVTVPASATSITVEDLVGPSPDKNAPVSPV
jgi:hypothetical protein